MHHMFSAPVALSSHLRVIPIAWFTISVRHLLWGKGFEFLNKSMKFDPEIKLKITGFESKIVRKSVTFTLPLPNTRTANAEEVFGCILHVVIDRRSLISLLPHPLDTASSNISALSSPFSHV